MNLESHRTIWLSDDHLGSRACRVALLADFLTHRRNRDQAAYGSYNGGRQAAARPAWRRVRRNSDWVESCTALTENHAGELALRHWREIKAPTTGLLPLSDAA
jgi:UDP-2,3-diacylglucosamine pyrophosphatase LpxH